MLIRVKTIILPTLVLTLGLLLPTVGLGKTIPVEGCAAQVNDRMVTVMEVMTAMQPVERQLRETTQGAELDRKLEEAYEKMLQALIERELILDAFRQQKEMNLPDKIVQSRTEEIVRTKFGNNRAAFRKALDQEGLTLEEWQANLKKSMIVAFLREREVDSKVSVSPQDVRAAYKKAGDTFRTPEQVHLRMIMINGGKTDEEIGVKRKQAEDVRKRLLEGELFDDLARQVSQSTRAKDGGDWGWIDPASRRPELAAAIRALKPGDISDVIPAGGDLYILKVEGRRDATVIPFEKVHDTLRTELEKQEAKRLYDDWMTRMKQKAFIKKY
ncbi:MAG: peptidyl-prolyl cis-trans isomerase [Verrucomicrobia bacterium]|nr:peptidyl-prolyl cis-trans isomerase [Verrucomicrobiota bacterium]MBU1735021.1 peptidyl-prolyl cis-trans isomerase [Verrucomicrobiota bacterium]MBU1856041.1 peptidyl-prolyl cis-trans isomerase [Verrucomicrobiota bacterium]